MTLPNIIIFISLLIINLTIIWFSNRKRRYGIYSSRIFALLFIVYWIYRLSLLILINDQATDINTQFQTVKKKKMDYSYDKILKNKQEMESELSGHVYYLHYIIKTSIMQSALVIVFSIIGLVTVTNRNKYYGRVLVVHVLFFIICFFLMMTDSLQGSWVIN